MRLAPASNTTGLSTVLVVITLLLSFGSAQITSAPNLSTADKATSTAAASTGSSSNSKSGATTTTGTASGSSSTATGTQTGSTTSIPRLTTTTSDSGGLTGLPKLSNGYSIPTAIVPSTAGAAFMQSSNLPEGTVFIIVGAILGFAASVVLVWRAGTAYMLHRSVKRAAYVGDGMDKAPLFRTPAAPVYTYADRDSKASLGGFGGQAANNNKGGLKNPFAGVAAGASSLFFSPTAGIGKQNGDSQNRTSAYLPAGYYAAGSAAPGDGRGSSYIGRESISLNNLAPQGHAYAGEREDEATPPGTPGFERIGHAHNPSSSTLNLGRLPNGRAPSAVLDDLFDVEGGARRH